jgi:hypothetical protein
MKMAEHEAGHSVFVILMLKEHGAILALCV